MEFAVRFIIGVLFFPLATVSLDNGVALTPPLGWNSWNAFKGKLDEKVVKQTADLLVSTGLAAKGYVYVNMDDTWVEERDNVTHKLVASTKKFPSGIPSLASYVHSKGLKFGIYTDVGHKTCAGRPGSWGFEALDAQTFADWKCDFVKSDSCFTWDDPSIQPANGPNCYARYQVLASALNATGRPMVHSIKGPCGRNHTLPPCSPLNASGVANLRRTSGDVSDKFSSVTRIVDQAANASLFSGPGFFADMDILEIGNGGMNDAEEKTMFTMWCIMKSPLLLGNDLSEMTDRVMAIVGNEALLAVNQDPLGEPARRVAVDADKNTQVWMGPLADGDVVLVFLNLGDSHTDINHHLSPGQRAMATDLWDPTSPAKVVNGTVTAEVGPHAVVALRLKFE